MSRAYYLVTAAVVLGFGAAPVSAQLNGTWVMAEINGQGYAAFQGRDVGLAVFCVGWWLDLPGRLTVTGISTMYTYRAAGVLREALRNELQVSANEDSSAGAVILHLAGGGTRVFVSNEMIGYALSAAESYIFYLETKEEGELTYPISAAGFPDVWSRLGCRR